MLKIDKRQLCVLLLGLDAFEKSKYFEEHTKEDAIAFHTARRELSKELVRKGKGLTKVGKKNCMDVFDRKCEAKVKEIMEAKE